MDDQLKVVNRGKQAPLRVQGSWKLWGTCMRQVALTTSGDFTELDILPNDHTYAGTLAYKFLLEVICCLHSPLLGETEIMGQFKDFRTSLEKNADFSLEKIFQSVVTDAKLIRSQCLKNLGGQSYGSLARQYVKGVEKIDVIGTGRLAKDILPWLIKEQQIVTVFGRSPDRLNELQTVYPNLKTGLLADGLQAAEKKRALIIAAPLSAELIQGLMGTKPFYCVLDLRGESLRDPVNSSVPVIDLQSFFTTMQQNQRQSTQAKEKANKEIQKLIEKRKSAMEIRPFGWDDLCA